MLRGRWVCQGSLGRWPESCEPDFAAVGGLLARPRSTCPVLPAPWSGCVACWFFGPARRRVAMTPAVLRRRQRTLRSSRLLPLIRAAVRVATVAIGTLVSTRAAAGRERPSEPRRCQRRIQNPLPYSKLMNCPSSPASCRSQGCREQQRQACRSGCCPGSHARRHSRSGTASGPLWGSRLYRLLR